METGTERTQEIWSEVQLRNWMVLGSRSSRESFGFCFLTRYCKAISASWNPVLMVVHSPVK